MPAQYAVKTDSRLAARCAATASIGAAVIHFAVTPMHWKDWLPSGLFFASIAVFQLVWGFIAWSRPTMVVLIAGILGNAGSAALWVLSRTAGAPFGPNAGQPEAVEAAGICVLLLQCYVVMGAGWALTRRYRTHEIPGYGRALVLLGANTVMVGAVTVALASGLQGHHHHHGSATEAEQEPIHSTHMDGHSHHADPVVPAGSGSTQPSPAPVPVESGRPVTDMNLNTGGDQPSADGHQHHHDD
ncbi:hypothetical protein BOH72_12735 [Mycobacterium sp. WY10]|nr:hypothetical protein BOH72_12735 [Mycobacterium sp. WY10]